MRRLVRAIVAAAAFNTAGLKKTDEVLCPMYHLGGFSGQNEIPRVAGQHYAHIVKQLNDFKARIRTNDAGNMTSVAGTLVQRGYRQSCALHREPELIRGISLPPQRW